MKKFAALIICILAVMLLFVACNSEPVDVNATEPATEKPTEAEVTEEPTEKPTEAKKVNYWEVKCRTIKEYKEEHFAISDDAERDLVSGDHFPADKMRLDNFLCDRKSHFM